MTDKMELRATKIEANSAEELIETLRAQAFDQGVLPLAVSKEGVEGARLLAFCYKTVYEMCERDDPMIVQKLVKSVKKATKLMLATEQPIDLGEGMIIISHMLFDMHEQEPAQTKATEMFEQLERLALEIGLPDHNQKREGGDPPGQYL